MVDKVGLAFVLLFVFVLILDLYFDSIVYSISVYPDMKTTYVYYPNGTVRLLNNTIRENYVYILNKNGTLTRRG